MEVIMACAKFRSKCRLPVLSYYNKSSQVSIFVIISCGFLFRSWMFMEENLVKFWKVRLVKLVAVVQMPYFQVGHQLSSLIVYLCVCPLGCSKIFKKFSNDSRYGHKICIRARTLTDMLNFLKDPPMSPQRWWVKMNKLGDEVAFRLSS